MKKGLILSLALALASATIALAQESKEDNKLWTIKGVAGINASQTSFVNWSAGGDNTVSLNGFFNIGAHYKKGKYIWDNDLSTEYGNTYTKTHGWVKSVDKLEISTKFGWEMASKWYLSSLVDFKTQYGKGYKNPDDANYISKIFAPAYSNVSVGFDYKPVDYFSLYMSPITAKMTFVADTYLSDLGAFGVDPGDRFKIEPGAYVKASFTKEIMKNVTLISKLDLFTAYDKSFGNIDVNWENVINMKVNKFISANIHANLLYDDDIKRYDGDGKRLGGARVQFKEMIGVGLSYNF
ncbi:hypothetical protein Bcop_1412 [Bacteroides coprosuis DSM 18011]|uniref:DUF3078 domain-containing protein n=1 Tax=Bacteroides coprosuis DSM 18011 TaxID=679937 RepID=F3ZPF0_9BACE|nr:DUF3078 domain-containing protein [Bacteroides coprosuis]EGJ71607.1 hypothetical protein Bcop_1412 [Bacteroides coprosuis DSM 18011]